MFGVVNLSLAHRRELYNDKPAVKLVEGVLANEPKRKYKYLLSNED